MGPRIVEPTVVEEVSEVKLRLLRCLTCEREEGFQDSSVLSG